ncbi:hypothetical protein BCR33DRAFT_741970 [Rhizoclosmatium globosum]|uniref:Zn(2)-C6 fungal-type domain-containing protein n=1 Tax=Rhizoclosmatium globosum TaxID=329046 RepID=A0A1Y2BTB3_9FUNG|nr:hypothetical protein BCR33DRAFT_741970 [Rhizoclosmatium globosum]|eukprot:ORY37981.1 hypothetical protein BCR33DRAFT_741970 [Rhizoclosmatium globosum]
MNKPCEDCRKHKKGCSKDIGGCISCKAKGVPCIYLTNSDNLFQSTSERNGWGSQWSINENQRLNVAGAQPQRQTYVSPFSNQTKITIDYTMLESFPNFSFGASESLNYQTLNTFDASLLQQEAANWELQDPDLMPSLKDWNLCHRFLTKDYKLPIPMTFSHDAEMFLVNFFSLPPVLIKCAVFARVYLLQEEALKYYKRARKAFLKIGFHPSLQDFDASTHVAHFAYTQGQPVIGMQFLAAGLAMLRKLKLHIDPDDSPWLLHMNFTERQKEDRRRAFWIWYSIFYVHQALCNDENFIECNDISCDKIKAPAQVYDPYPIFAPMPTLQSECKVLELFVKIKRRLMIPPTNVHALLSDSSVLFFERTLQSIQSAVPNEVRLELQSPDTICRSDEALFINKIAAGEYRLQNHSYIDPSCFYPTSNRSIHSLSPQLTVKQYPPQSVTAKFSKTLRQWNLELKPVNYSIEWYFECFVVIWFALCKMDQAWWQFTSIQIHDFSGLRTRLHQSVDELEKESAEGGYFTPILECMNAMLVEIDQVLKVGRNPGVDGMKELELGMRIISIGGVDEDILETRTTEPYVILGLLGLEVSGGLRFKGRSEESWRLFWKLNS